MNIIVSQLIDTAIFSMNPGLVAAARPEDILGNSSTGEVIRQHCDEPGLSRVLVITPGLNKKQ
jgi:hypothetical protein